MIWNQCIARTEGMQVFFSIDQDHDLYLSTTHPSSIFEKIMFVETISDNLLYIGAYHAFLNDFTRHLFFKTQEGNRLYEFPVMDTDLFITKNKVSVRSTCRLVHLVPSMEWTSTMPDHPFLRQMISFLSV